MNASTESLFGQFLEPVFRALPRETAAEIAKLTADPSFQARIEYLAGQSNEGVLTEEELAEYEALIDAGDMLATLQAIARRTLSEASSCLTMRYAKRLFLGRKIDVNIVVCVKSTIHFDSTRLNILD